MILTHLAMALRTKRVFGKRFIILFNSILSRALFTPSLFLLLFSSCSAFGRILRAGHSSLFNAKATIPRCTCCGPRGVVSTSSVGHCSRLSALVSSARQSWTGFRSYWRTAELESVTSCHSGATYDGSFRRHSSTVGRK